MEDLWGEPKANNAGLVVTTLVAVGNLCHTLPIGRTAKITKIMWYNNTGALQTITFGTWDNTLPASLFVALFPAIDCVNNMDGELTEEEIPPVEFVLDTRLAALGATGDIYVLGSVANIQVRLEIREKGA